jgi:DNA-binding MarR family transcriptional regulator
MITKVWNNAFAPLGLSPAHAYLIRLVLEKPGLMQKEIGQELHLEKSTITRFIDKMVEAGYLKRKVKIKEESKHQYIYATGKAQAIKIELENIGDTLYKKSQQLIELDDLAKLVKDMRDITEWH